MASHLESQISKNVELLEVAARQSKQISQISKNVELLEVAACQSKQIEKLEVDSTCFMN
jgi:hypothetical protein